MTTSFLAPSSLPYIVHVYDHNVVFKKTVQILNHPVLSMVVNSVGQQITLDMPAANTVSPAIVQGDIIKITEQNGDGNVIYTGIVEDLPDNIDQTVTHQVVLAPLGVELGETDFTNNYTSATDISQMIRDAVARCTHCTATVSTVPNTGLTRIFNFNETNVLTVLQTAAKMAGANYIWFVDELGQVWFGPTSSGVTYSAKTRVDAPVRKYTAPINTLKNFVQGFGAVIPNTDGTRVSATYDQTTGSVYGRRALIPPLHFPNLTDQPTLQSIVNTVGAALNQIQVTVVLELPNFGKRINLAQVGGASIRYFEPTTDVYPETDPGSGAYSASYVIMQVDVDGPVQTITARGIALNVDDFVNEINDTMNRVANDTVPALYPITPGQVQGATQGGSNTPATPGWDFAHWNTGIDNTAQVNNAYIIVRWTPNIASDNVGYYEIRYSKGADGNYYRATTASPAALDGNGDAFLKIAGLIQGQSYTFEVRAVNNLGVAGSWSSTQAQVAANDSTAPAVPTGLTAIKTPRGALVSWNGNTEADLQGYEVQVSVGGGAYSLVTPGPTLATSLAYTAPSGTALGTSLQFQIRAVDWSGNFSAYSSASTAVNTDGIVFDELLVGNLKVFGTITTGGLQTASSGARVVIDSAGIRIYDGSSFNYGAPSGQGVTAELKNDGTAFFKGTVSASNVYGSVIATSAVIGNIGSGAGFKLAGQFLDLYTVGSTSEGTRYWYAPDNVTAFILAGQLAAGVMTFAKGGADSNTEQITTTGTPVVADAMAIASFKPNTTIALVGSLGAFTSAAAGSITPAFGQATTSGNLLVAWVACNAASPPSINTAASGWVKAVAANATNVEADIWYKANCGASETAPTFTATLQAPSGADNVSETITNLGGLLGAVLAIATFKAATGSTIALVKAGPFTTKCPTSSADSITPAFGQSTSSGNLLVAWVSISDTNGTTGEVSTSASGWTRLVVSGLAGNAGANEVGIFYKANCGTGEAAPTFTANSNSFGATVLYAQLAEFSGAQTSSVSDQTGTVNVGFGPANPQVVTAGGADAAAGDLVVSASRWAGSSFVSQGITFSDTGNNAGPTGIGNSGGGVVGSGGLSFGPATGVTSTSLTDTAQSWTTNQWGNWVVTMGGAFATVSSNTGTVLTTSSWLPSTPATGTYILLFPARASNFTYGIVPTPTMHARLAEFSGALTASPLDKTGTANQTSASASLAVAASAVDAGSADLILTAARWQQTSASTASWTDSYNNATPVSAGDSGGSSLSQHSRFSYGIIANSPTGEVLQITNFVGLEAITTANSLGRGIITTQYSSDIFGSSFVGRKARGTSAAPTAIANGDRINEHSVQAYDGTNWFVTGRISFDVNGTVSAGNIPTDFNVRLNPNNGTEFIAASFPSTGGLLIPPSVGGAFAASSYGSVPVKFAETLLGSLAASVSFTSIPSAFRNLESSSYCRSDTASTNTNLNVRVNGDSTANYDTERHFISGTAISNPLETLAATAAIVAGMPAASDPANLFGTGRLYMVNYSGTTGNKLGIFNGYESRDVTTGNQIAWVSGFKWRTAATAINRLDYIPSAGNFIVGCYFDVRLEP